MQPSRRASRLSPESRVTSDREIKELDDGHRARTILDHPMYQEAVQHVRDTLTNVILTSQPEEADKREDAYQQIRAIEKVESHLRKFLDTAKMAGIERARRAEQRRRAG